MRKRILCMFLSIVMVLGLLPVITMAAELVAWDGTTVDTDWYNTTGTEFTLTTAAQLAGFAAITNGTAEGITADTFSGKTVKLGADIDLNLQEWTPIVNFSGTFDGQNFTVSNLKITVYAAQMGLFGSAQNAELKNALIAGIDISHTSTSKPNIGGLLGQGSFVKVINCGVSNGSIRGNAYNAGGLIGSTYADDANKCYVEYCFNYNVVVDTTGNYKGSLIGQNNSQAKLSSSYAYVSAQKDAPLSIAGRQNYASNCVSLATTTNTKNDKWQTEEQFASGVVTGYLNEYTGGSLKWGQELGVDAVPSIGGMPMERIQTGSDNTYAYVNAELTTDTDGTYIIRNAAEWVAFANKVKYNNYSNLGISARVEENATIDFSTIPGWENGIPTSSAEYLRIGFRTSSQYPYTGNFDGNGCVVKGLNFTESLAGNNHFALFGNVSKGTIKNITIENISINTSRNAAGLVLFLTDGTLENCHITSGSIEGTSTSYAVSGLVVQSKNATIKNCSNGANITAATSSGTGGILAYVGTNSTVTIENCVNTGNITSTSYNVGGIAGKLISNCTVSECYNTGAITAPSIVGGLVGSFSVTQGKSGKITNSYNLGAVKGGDTAYTIGGILGDGTPTLTNCYNAGFVTGKTCAQPLIGKKYSDSAFDVTKVINTYSLQNCVVTDLSAKQIYYGSDGKNRLTVGKTANDFSGGAIAYLLQNGTDGSVWGQQIGTDLYPVLDKTNKVVKITFAMANGETGKAPSPAYANAGQTLTTYPVHPDAFTEYKFYSDAAGTSEISQETQTYSDDSTIYVKEVVKDAYILALEGTPDSFADLIYGYTTGRSVTYTFQNIGNQPITGITASIIEGDTAFEIVGSYDTTVAVGGIITLTVTSKTGLEVNGSPYQGTLKLTWTNGSADGLTVSLEQTVLKANADNYSVSLAEWTYGDTPNTPVVMHAGNDVTSDCTITYKADSAETYSETIPTAAGTHTVKAAYSATENYNAGETTATFTIAPKSIADAVVTLTIPASGYTYDGTEMQPAVASVTINDTPLDAADFTIAYSNNINAGDNTATVTVTGTGNYTGTKEAKFTIGKATLTIHGTGTATGTYGDTLAELVVSGPAVTMDSQTIEGTWAFNDSTVVPEVNGTVSYTATFTPATGADNFNPLTCEITPTITKAAYINLPDITVPVLNSSVQSGEIPLADLFGATTIPTGAHITAVEHKDNVDIMDAVDFTDAAVIYTSKNNSHDMEGSTQYEVTITSNNQDYKIIITFTNERVYLVTFDPNGGSVNPTSAVTNDAYQLNNLPIPSNGRMFTFAGWYTAREGGTKVTESFTYNADTTIYARWKLIDIPVPYYFTLSFDTAGGTVFEEITRFAGAQLSLYRYTPEKEGYIFTGWFADAALTEEITSIRFIKDTTIYAGWQKIEEEVQTPFTDISDADWYYDDVLYVYENGLMNGTDTDLFSPAMGVTRGMIATILYRLEGEPTTANLSNPFTDLTQVWYTDAVKWAADKEIVNGYGNGIYGPEDPIIREQLATILWRYAQYKNLDVSTGEDTNILSYNDAFDIAEYAIPAMQWACGESLINIRAEYTLAPAEDALRYEIAVMLHRFCETYLDN